MKLFRRLIARADPGCMSKPRWLSAAVNKTREWPEKKKHPCGSASASFGIMEQGAKPFLLGVVLVIVLLSTQLNLGNGAVPMPTGLEPAGWVTAHCSGPEAAHSTNQQTETRDLICCFKDLFKLFPSPHVKGGFGKANDYYYFPDLLVFFRADCSSLVCRISLCVFPQKIVKVSCNAFILKNKKVLKYLGKKKIF